MEWTPWIKNREGADVLDLLACSGIAFEASQGFTCIAYAIGYDVLWM